MLNLYIQSYRHMFNFYGCTSRGGYVAFMVLSTSINLLLFLYMISVVGEDNISVTHGVYQRISTMAFMVHFLLSTFAGVSLTIRRLHSLGMSSWWSAIVFLPWLNIVFIVFLMSRKEIYSRTSLLY
jgi:uncharacterized membrane protein YhaH (DUF805 family)